MLRCSGALPYPAGRDNGDAAGKMALPPLAATRATFPFTSTAFVGDWSEMGTIRLPSREGVHLCSVVLALQRPGF